MRISLIGADDRRHVNGDSEHRPRHPCLALGMLVLVSIYFIKAVLLAFLAWRQSKLAADVQVQLSQRLFKTYLQQPYAFHLQRNSPHLVRAVYTKVATISDAVYHSVNLVTEVLVLLSVSALLLIVEPVCSGQIESIG
jgi:hypothetical protein